MRVGIVGGTAFVGNYLIQAFLEKGLRPVLLVRPGSEHKVRRRADCDLISGDVNHMSDITKVLQNCEAAVYNVGILREQRSRGITFEALQYEGPESLTWQEILRRVAEAVGRQKWLLPMPIEVMKLAASLLDWLPAFPVTRDQLTMLAESNTGDPAQVNQLTGRKPKAFNAGSLAYLTARTT